MIYLILFSLALVSTWWIYKKVLKIAIIKNIVDKPEARKIQLEPVPVLGGLAVFFGIVVALTSACFYYEMGSLFVIMGALAIMLYVGTLDDILGLSPAYRFVVEILVVLLLIFCNKSSLDSFHGLWNIYTIPQYLSVPLTVFACVGIMNAINLIDGVNGLSSGYCIAACICFFITFLVAGDKYAACLAAVSAGSLIPFFCHNVFGSKSKMFIGDGGALMMGTVLASLVIIALSSESILAARVDDNFGIVAFTLAVLAIPVFDTLRVMFARIVRGRSPFQPDRTHFHHLLFDLGFSHIGTTSFEILSNMLVVLLWWLSYRSGASADLQLYIVVFTSVLITFGFYKFVRIQIQKQSKIYYFLQKIGAMTHVGHSSWFLKFRDFLDRGCSGIKREC